MKISDLSFHEATVVTFDYRAGVVRLGLADVKDDDRKRAANIAVRDITGIVSDGISVDHVAMVYEDGEVLTLECSGEELYVIIQWNDFESRRSLTKSYRVGGKVTVDIVPEEAGTR